ncbi:hypothetical protein CANINC_003717 [Pichia inconspicua]|uniref:Uncharacterized protein n=1 Tax=Pichia inconspicua TaxID=52247 RepID=A0A4V6TTQ3_9ASCO|nr:hypothetical protein CANINC_003717 [[Candida] inconspicua]
MSSNTTDLSSDFDITAVETDAFDKNQLISWASKLELESIDNRATSIDLMEALSKISRSLTDSLQAVDKHLFQIKLHSTQRETKFKDFIQVTLSEELDVMYSRISHLVDKINELQSGIQNMKEENVKQVELRIKQIQSDQHQFNCLVLEKLSQLESRTIKTINSKISTPDLSPVKSPVKSPKLLQPNSLSERKFNSSRPTFKVMKTYKERPKRSNVTQSKQSRRGETSTRRLIMD